MNANSSHVIGVDIGGTKVLSIVASRTEIIDREQVESGADGPEILDRVEESIAALLERAATRPTGIGVGMAGFIGLDGIARTAPNTEGLLGVDVAGRLSKRFDMPVTVENDANCVAIAARDQVARDKDLLVAVTLGTGIGGGVIVGGEILRGANGFAGEPGHMVIDPSGPLCPCGQHGCWERFASGSGLAWLAQRAARAGDADSLVNHAGSIEQIIGQDVSDLAREGDEAAQRVFEEFAFYLALGLANLTVMFDPQMILIGGGLAALGEQLLEPVRRALAEKFPSTSGNRENHIVMAPGGPDAGAWGAALLVRQ